jgi:hypothetical protein
MQPLQRLKYLFLEFARILGCAYGLFMLMAVVFPPLHSQSRVESEQQSDLERRIAALESMNVDHRLTILETIRQESEDSLLWSRVSTGGMGLLVMERMAGILRKRIANPNDPNPNPNSTP